MSAVDALDRHRPEFERFLYASVGKDRNGSVVTVLSTLARLNLDPWQETSELVVLGHDAARSRLGLLLSRFSDVPALGRNHGSVARDLTLLLPEYPARSAPHAGPSAQGRLVASGALWAVATITLILLHTIFAGAPGASE